MKELLVSKMVSILHKEVGQKSGHANYKRTTLAVLQRKIKTNRNFQHMNKPYKVSSLFVHFVVKNKEGAGREGEGRGGFITFFLYCKRRQINKTCMFVCMY